MIDALVFVAPFGQAVVDIVLVGVELASRCHSLRNHRFDVAC
jgi:hypothetical protein